MNVIVIKNTNDLEGSLNEFITGIGHNLKTASFGHEALLMLDREKIDVVLIELNRPIISGVMKGMDFTRVTRRLYPDKKVIIVARSKYVENAINIINFGAYAVFRKPLNFSMVKETFKRLEQEIIKKGVIGKLTTQ